MKLISELGKSINGFLQLDKRRMDCFVKIIVALMITQTVNLKKISCAMFGNARTDSNYRRLQRFFSAQRLNYNAIAKLLFHLFSFHIGKHYLILDRTNWKWGKKDINILFLCVAYKKIAIPIFWLVLNKKGNSSTRERMVVIQRFIDVFGRENIAALMGDREFIGKRWFEYLKQCDLSFYFRVKKDAETTNARGKSISIHWLFLNLPLHQSKLIREARRVYGHELFITGMRIEDDYVIVVTNQEPEADNPDEAMLAYSVRWEIETLFGCLKSKGFNFEDTHITQRDRIKKIIAVLAVAFCWAHLTGEWRHKNEKTIRLKKHGRPQHSLFRYGLDWISEKLIIRGVRIRKLTNLCRQIFDIDLIHECKEALC